MAPLRSQNGHRLVLVLACLVLAAPTSPLLAAEPSLYPTDYFYLDIDGTPLPFQDSATILDALRTGEVVEQKLMSRGVAHNLKLILEYRGCLFHAVFRVVDVTEREKTGSKRIVLNYRDFWGFEIAAYALNELLGIGRIPLVVERTIGGAPGSVQIWMEGTKPEDLLLEEGRLNPPDRTYWWQQKSIMWVFDALIANTDRNQGNLLIDHNWDIFFIDHTRAFRETSKLFDVGELKTCEKGLWAALQDTTDEAIRQRLEGYLTSRELTKLLLRRQKLVKHIQTRIDKDGEDKVLYVLSPPKPAKSPQP